MPAITIHDVRRSGGTIAIRFGKVEREFDSVAALRQWVRETAPQMTPEQLHAVALRGLLPALDSFADVQALRGRTFDVSGPESVERQ